MACGFQSESTSGLPWNRARRGGARISLKAPPALKTLPLFLNSNGTLTSRALSGGEGSQPLSILPSSGDSRCRRRQRCQINRHSTPILSQSLTGSAPLNPREHEALSTVSRLPGRCGGEAPPSPLRCCQADNTVAGRRPMVASRRATIRQRARRDSFPAVGGWSAERLYAGRYTTVVMTGFSISLNRWLTASGAVNYRGYKTVISSPASRLTHT